MQTTSQLRLRKGFVLVEVLASIVIASIVGISVAELVSLFLKQLDQVTDLVTARQRGEMILSQLELPVLRAGLFMPILLMSLSQHLKLVRWIWLKAPCKRSL